MAKATPTRDIPTGFLSVNYKPGRWVTRQVISSIAVFNPRRFQRGDELALNHTVRGFLRVKHVTKDYIICTSRIRKRLAGYIRISACGYSLYIATERWLKLGRKAIRIEKEANNE
jgi:hypothetical protein